MNDAQAKVVVTADGGYRRGAIVPLKANVDDAVARIRRRSRTSWSCGARASRSRMQRRARPLVPRADGRGVGRLPGRAARLASTRSSSSTPAARPGSRRASCTPPAATCCTPPAARAVGLRPEGRRHLLVHRRHRLGDRAQLRRLRPLANGATSVMYEGAPNHPDPDRLWQIIDDTRRHDLLHRAHRHPRLHQVGRPVAAQARPRLAAPARHRRRADQPRGLDVVPPRRSARSAARSSTPGGRRRPAAS